MTTQLHRLNRLPQYDARTRRAELAAFASLGLGAVTLIAAATVETLRFADHADDLAQALSWDSAMLAQVHPGTNRGVTNLTIVPQGMPGLEHESQRQGARS